MEKPLISFEDFSFKYHSQAEPTLHHIDLQIYPGEKIAIVGPSGSGKSTFSHCINGLIPHQYEGTSQGRVFVNGKDNQEVTLGERSFDVGTVLQDTDGQFIGLTVAEDIAFALENDAVNNLQMNKEVQKWAKEVELMDFLAHRPQDLSGGQKQRVSIAGVLINETPILLFDEPLANLDPASGKETIRLIDKIHKKTGATILIIEHRLEDVLYRDVDRIIVFNEGEIVADQTPDTLLKTNILASQGIREPLYVTAMKYAGVDLTSVSGIEKSTNASAPQLKEQIEKWVAKQKFHMDALKMEDLLKLEKLTYQYHSEERLVLDEVSTTFHKGEMVSIVGKNGAGKSTLCKAICGFIQPKSGKMTWKKQDFQKLSIKERADKIGFVMQNPNQMISKKMIADEVGLGLVLRGIPQAEIKERVERVLKICGLYSFRNWPISALSFGQKKRVTIAAILVLDPEMIILDEPTAGQDFKHYTEMMHFLEELNQTGVTIVMITHDMHLMLEYTERALVVSEGLILADTAPVSVLTNPELIAKAQLKETSLFTFAKQIGLANPLEFVQTFIRYDRQVRFQ